jgi:hypothetical protein
MDSTDRYLFGDSGHWGFLLKGTLSWILLQTFCHQPRPKYYNFIKIIKGAANPCTSCYEHIVNASGCFGHRQGPKDGHRHGHGYRRRHGQFPGSTSKLMLRGSVAPNKWCNQFSAQISKIVFLVIYFLNW